MKIIFLDIDGVLNSDRSIKAFKMPTPTDIETESYRVRYLVTKTDPVAVHLLNSITDDTDAKIVVSSANRIFLGLAGVRDVLKRVGVTGEIIDVTLSLRGCRGDEIHAWLMKSENISHYVIIDDSCDMLPFQMENFVRIDPRYGLSYEDCKKINSILGLSESSLILI